MFTDSIAFVVQTTRRILVSNRRNGVNSSQAFSLAHPYAYTQAYADIAADGEIISATQYLSRRPHEAAMVVREYRAFFHAA